MTKEDWPQWQDYVDGLCVCVYCGLDGTTSLLAFHQLLVDHLIPRGKGGLDIPENRVVVCYMCNTLKASLWDKSYDAVGFSGKTKTELLESARSYVLAYYQKKVDGAYEPMMEEIRRKKGETGAAGAAAS